MDHARADRRIGRAAWVLAWVGLVMGQLHAMAGHNTVDGKDDLQVWTTRVWSDPVRQSLQPLLDWASPDAVYLTYGKIWLPVFVAFTACAFVVRRRRGPVAEFEKWAWRVALTGYLWACIAVFATYRLSWAKPSAVFGPAFLVLTVPGMMLTLLGSTVLGVVLLRRRFRPRATAWLLTLTIPLAFVALQFTSMGSAALPVMFAFAVAGRQLSLPVAGPQTTLSGSRL